MPGSIPASRGPRAERGRGAGGPGARPGGSSGLGVHAVESLAIRIMPSTAATPSLAVPSTTARTEGRGATPSRPILEPSYSKEGTLRWQEPGHPTV